MGLLETERGHHLLAVDPVGQLLLLWTERDGPGGAGMRVNAHLNVPELHPNPQFQAQKHLLMCRGSGEIGRDLGMGAGCHVGTLKAVI
jgi:hypothetical protein